MANSVYFAVTTCLSSVSSAAKHNALYMYRTFKCLTQNNDWKTVTPPLCFFDLNGMKVQCLAKGTLTANYNNN